jgi:hypothetical protein
MGELTITFSGICGHYTGVVPGVPHRVVMPDASGVHFGMVSTPGGNAGLPMAYCLLPHQVIWMTGPVDNPDQRPNFLAPSRLRVVNAVDSKMDYMSSYCETVPRISDYVPRFNYSRDVVLGGRAAAYFDIFGGTVTALTSCKGVVTVLITMETEGAPVLGVTPFALDGSSVKEQSITLESNELTIANSDIETQNEDKTFDFLLHYLAAEEGLPLVLRQATPGMGDVPKGQSWHDMADALRGLACVVEHHGPGGSESTPPRVMNASCSDSRYP